jgi:hypothetical protein
MKDEKVSGIKLDFDVPLRTVTGEPMMEQEEGREPKPFVIRRYVANLLWNLREKENAEVNNAILAMKIMKAKEPIVLKDEERVLIKGIVKKQSSPGVLFQIMEWLEGKDPFE